MSVPRRTKTLEPIDAKFSTILREVASRHDDDVVKFHNSCLIPGHANSRRRALDMPSTLGSYVKNPNFRRETCISSLKIFPVSPSKTQPIATVLISTRNFRRVDHSKIYVDGNDGETLPNVYARKEDSQLLNRKREASF